MTDDARRSIQPDPGRRLIITTMRDEAPFVLEWIAYHRLIGFTDFLVYSNDCTDGTDLLLDRLQQLGVLAHEPNPRTGRKAVQWRALSRARNHPLYRAAGWVMVADVDEFLTIHAGDGRLEDLFAAAPGAGGFVVTWRMFGSSGRLKFEPGLVMDQFVRAAPDGMLWPLRASQVKTLFRASARLHRLGVHRPQWHGDGAGGDGWVDGNGRPVRPDVPAFNIGSGPKYGLAQINHYALGSAESFLVKAARGRPNHMDVAIGLDYWVERNFNAVEDRSILRHRDGVQAAVADLLSDPVVRDLHEAGIAHRRARIDALLRDHDVFRLFSLLAQSPDTPVLPADVQIALCRLRRHAPPRPAGQADRPGRSAPDVQP